MKKVFKAISCFFIFNFCLNCYSNLIINTAERAIVYNNRKIIISYEEDELIPVLSELLKYQNTKLLLEAIALKLEKLENIKIIISKGGESGDNGGYCVGLENEYILKVWYQDLQKKIYRPIVFFFNDRYRMSYLEVPPYIALAHELEHVLNRLELFEQSMSRDVFINGCKQGLKELQKTSLCSIDALIINGFINNEDIVMEKTSVSSYLEFIGYIMQKKIKML